VLPPISETQLVAMCVVLLLCGAGVGFILGGLWMEQRLNRRHSSQVKELLQSRRTSSPAIRRELN